MNFKELPASWSWRIKKVGLTQVQFAEKANISFGALNKAINKRTDPKLSFVHKVEQTLKELEESQG